MSQKRLTPEDRVKFILAGKARLSVVSKKTSVKITFLIQKPKDGNRVRFVSVLQDHLDGQRWTYIGHIIVKGRDGSMPFFWGGIKKAGFLKADYRVVGFEWLWYKLSHGIDVSKEVEMLHTGRCGRCGRKLIDPKSIRTGLGPICRMRLS